jgi:MSHA biogenesis protein MshJ
MDARALIAKYEALTLRERAILVLAIVAVMVLSWDTMLMEPLRLKRSSLEAELATATTFGLTAQNADASDPRQLSITQAGELQRQLQSIDAQLASTASGFVSSQRMIEVLNDVLDRQGRLGLVSIRNLPVSSLIAPIERTDDSAEGASGAAPAPAVARPPYVHTIELVIDGQYADILEYLAALEALPWKFRWTSFDLSTAGYPRNRVRIELSTLSLDSTWLGV